MTHKKIIILGTIAICIVLLVIFQDTISQYIHFFAELLDGDIGVGVSWH